MSATFQPNTTATVTNTKSITCNTVVSTASFVVFTVTGSIRVLQLYGVVTTVLSAAHTAAHWRLNDQTSTPAITLATGTDLSAAPAKSLIIKTGLAAAALTLVSSAAGAITEPTTLETVTPSEFIVTKKAAATTTIDYRYTTTDNPSSGVIQFFLVWQPLSADAAVS